MSVLAVETILGSHSDLEFQKQYVCPSCLASFSIQEAEVWDYGSMMNQQHCVNIECMRGHSTPFNALV